MMGRLGGESLLHAWKGLSKRLDGGWKEARNRIYKHYGIASPTTPKKNWARIIITIIAAVALVAATAVLAGTYGVAASTWTLGQSVAMGAALGAATSASMTAIQGGSWGDILRSGLRGAVTGAISAGIAHGIGDFFMPKIAAAAFNGHWTTAALLNAARIGLHGVTQGAISAATGGSFRDGFIGAVVSGYLSPYVGSKLPDNMIIQGIGAAVVGGTASMLAGGKFANGAMSAAFSYLFNDLAGHRLTGDARYSRIKAGLASGHYRYFGDPLITQELGDEWGNNLVGTSNAVQSFGEKEYTILSFLLPAGVAKSAFRSVGSGIAYSERLLQESVRFGARGFAAWTSEGAAAAVANGATIMQPSIWARITYNFGYTAPMRAEAATFARTVTGEVTVYEGANMGKIFTEVEWPILWMRRQLGEITLKFVDAAK